MKMWKVYDAVENNSKQLIWALGSGELIKTIKTTENFVWLYNQRWMFHDMALMQNHHFVKNINMNCF